LEEDDAISMHDPSKTADMLEEEDAISMHEPSKTANMLEEDDAISMHDPSKTADILEEEDAISMHEPSKTADMLEADGTFSMHEPRKTADMLEADGTLNVNTTKNTKKLSPETAKCVTVALTFAEKEEELLDPGGVTDPNTPAEGKEWLDRSKLHDADGDISIDTFSKHKEALFKALEMYDGGVSVEEGLKKGCVLTPTIWEELRGLADTPELGPKSSCVQGDMCGDTENETALLQEAVGTGARWAGKLWPNPAAIPYCIAGSLSTSARQAMLDSFQHFKNMVPCLGFKQVQVASDYKKTCTQQGIYIGTWDDGGCFAIVGAPRWSRGKSYINLGRGCDTLGVAAHELGHSLGMTHEQSRTDSQNYVKILWNNIQREYRDQYEFNSGASRSEPYDIMSLMHYGDDAFGRHGADGRPMKTMKAYDKKVSVMGNRMGLTLQDTLQLGKMYGCESQVKHLKMCSNDPLRCTTGACGCRQDASKNNENIKIEHKNGCFQCARRCATYNYGTPRFCGCPTGMTKGSFSSRGTKYSYCKDSAPPNCPTYPNGNSGNCGCPSGKEKGSFSSRGRTYYYCKAPDCPTYPRGTSGNCGCPSGKTKGSFSSRGRNYYYCKAPDCPTYPQGTSGNCGCPSGKTKGSFSSRGRNYYYCQ